MFVVLRVRLNPDEVITAVARELLGFIWAIGTRAETIANRQAAG